MPHQLIDAGPAGLDPEELAALRANLEDQRRFRHDQLREFERSAASRDLRPGERASPGQLEVHVQLAASARMVLVDVEAALERMDRGGYGRCHRCGLPIPFARLEIVPQARYCGGCHRVKETAH
ncbi:TraR/DksA family transcriptional regulator [Streptomyces pinistramenti]|uniref:TraR/DksA family transcriptional regulator n=1 Tax=Streptomyces pinistramenti TaxID=2884812 RepID=UPI001D097687|nr:TraR/DksA family transcriptional regulator [Streptomyces pinistramenti]MCB5911106.1 TraR/DksA family transcriptional regulator [Streptomyces pinistramenti]